MKLLKSTFIFFLACILICGSGTNTYAQFGAIKKLSKQLSKEVGQVASTAVQSIPLSESLGSGKFSNYYGSAVPFTSGGKTYIFAQNSSKRWFITELKPDGSGFYNDTASGKWKNYYGATVPFTSGGKTYIFAQSSSKRWFISELTPDGSGFEIENASGKWKNYYSTIVPFTSGGKTYIFAQSSSRRWFISELTPDGSGFEIENASGKFNTFYGTAVPFTSDGKNYIYAQNSSKRWFITELKPDGSGFYNDTASGKFSNYYSAAVPFTSGGKTFIFAQNGSTRWFVTELKPNGGGFYNDTGSGIFENYYGSMVPFYSGGKAYVFAQSSSKHWFIKDLSAETGNNSQVVVTGTSTEPTNVTDFKSGSQSNLSGNGGFDFVVATTQASINATMKEYLSTLPQPEVKICFVENTDGNPVKIDCDELMALANGTDPFSIPADVDPETNQDIQNLDEARFMMGFKAQIGLPPGLAPANIPDIITLGSNTASVKYQMLCSEFTVVELKVSARNPSTWMNESQPPGSPWIFTSLVDLRLEDIENTAYGNLADSVKAQILNLKGNAFSVQQLLFDLDNAALQSLPQEGAITGVDPTTNLYYVLDRYFMTAYFNTLKTNGDPMLGVTITQTTAPPASLTLTNLNINVNPFKDENGQSVSSPTDEQKDLSTLNYLCAANDNQLPPAQQFPWNWIDPSEASDYHGVIAVNGQTYAQWLSGQFSPNLQDLCRQPYCHVSCNFIGCTLTLDYTPEPDAQVYDILAEPEACADGFMKIMTFSYSASDSDDDTFVPNYSSLSSTYKVDSDVCVLLNQIKVITTVTVHVRVNVEGGVSQGDYAKYVTTDLFTLSVNDEGKVICEYSTDLDDQSEDVDADLWAIIVSAGTVNDVLSSEKEFAENRVTNYLEGFNNNIASSINGPSAWIFPGGETFSFKDVGFSENQDLISHLIYAQPR